MRSGKIYDTAFRLVQVCRVDEVPAGGMKCIRLENRDPIAVYNVNGQFYATDDRCTHGQASLSEEGFLDGCVIECSWHLGAFDIRSGEAVSPPCDIPLRTYTVIVSGEHICIQSDGDDG